MSSFNKVILMGNLTRDPELRFTNNQMAVCKVGLAVNRRFKDSQTGDWREEATFVDITIFGKRGEAFQKYHTKGQSAFFEGSLRFDQWEDKQTGQKRSKLYVVADNWEFVGGQGGGGGQEGGGGGYQVAGGGGYAPGPAAAPAGDGGGYQAAPDAGGYGASGGAQGGSPGYVDADDTPF